jgi:hypothetical protein
LRVVTALNVSHECLRRLHITERCSYSSDGAWAAEPTALASLALAFHRFHKSALRFGEQLADVQQSDGAVPALAERDSPSWTTSLAILAWLACRDYVHGVHLNRNIELAINWSLTTHGKPAPRNPQIGHDPTILGWSWAAETHAWMEPTCMFVIALKAAGLSDHQRTRDGVRLVTDRLLPNGGSNFGSTLVLGQATLPQVESTGLAMLALAGEKNSDPRVEKSLQYLEANLIDRTTTASLCYGLMGLAAHNRRPPHAEAWLAAALEREIKRGQSAFKLALLALASVPDMSWLPRRAEAHA